MEDREKYVVGHTVLTGVAQGNGADTLELNPVQINALATFPDIERGFHAKLQEGYKLLTFKYEANEITGHESLDIVFSKGYERFVMKQGKGHYAGGYSHATFGREGERGQIL